MAQFGYQILGFGGHTPAGGPGDWTTESDTINSNRYQSVAAGSSASAIIAGGSGTGDSEVWNGTTQTWSDAADNLSSSPANAASGGGTATSAIFIGGNREGSTTLTCEKWTGSDWENADSTTTVFTAAASGATDMDTAWVCGGWTGSAIGAKCEVLKNGTWQAGTDMLTDRLAMAKNQAGSGTNGAAVTGSTGSISDKNEQHEFDGGSSASASAWSTHSPITTGLTDDPSCFGQTSADDLVVAFGENATAPQGDCLEYNNEGWTDGNTAPSTNRNNYGGGPTGAGIVTGGYNETAGAYQDDTYTFKRAIST